MTEKGYDYSELKDGTYGVFKDKYHDDIDISFSQRFCIVENEEQARSIVGQLNSLADENGKLKQEYKKLKHRHSLLHDVCLNAECERDSLKKDVKSLEKENEQLKSKIKLMSDVFLKFEEIFYVNVCEKSEHYDEKVLNEITNSILGD